MAMTALTFSVCPELVLGKKVDKTMRSSITLKMSIKSAKMTEMLKISIHTHALGKRFKMLVFCIVLFI